VDDSTTPSRFPWTVVPALQPGEKRSGYLTLPDRLLAGYEWPYVAARGVEPGPAVAVVAGIHGGEYPGVLGAQRLARVLNPARLRGALLVLPIVNLTSFWERSAFATPQDGRNLNRQFPGRAGGTFSEVLAFRLMQDILGPADAVIDLHSGDVFETLANHVGRYITGDATVDALSERMAAAFGLPYAMTSAIPDSPPPRTLTGNVAALGKPVLLVEVGGNALASDGDVQSVFQGLVNTLRVLDVLEGLPAPPDVPTRWVERGEQLTAPSDGLWRPAVALEQQVNPGDLLGTLTDVLGEPLAQATATQAGIVLYYMSALAVREGEPLVNVVRLAGSTPR
jgi:hypothetical protein